MNKSIKYKNIQVSFSSYGRGKVIVLLHGFLEDSSMWKEIVLNLKENYRVITIDLLGHGKTPCLERVYTLKEQAILVHTVLQKLKLRKYIIIGHSFGGYVALSFAKLYLKNVVGLCLLNATYKADNKNRKLLRLRSNNIAKQNLKKIVKTSFLNLFSERSKILYKKEIKIALKVALKISLQSYLATQEGMRVREDYSSFFKKLSCLKLIVLGEKDPIIDYKKLFPYTQKHQIPLHLLSEGHMSYIENKKETIEILNNFVKRAFAS